MTDKQTAERVIAIRAIEAYLTADKIAHRQPKATQILVALERLGYQLAKVDEVCPECLGACGKYDEGSSQYHHGWLTCPTCQGKKDRPDSSKTRIVIAIYLSDIQGLDWEWASTQQKCLSQADKLIALMPDEKEIRKQEMERIAKILRDIAYQTIISSGQEWDYEMDETLPREQTADYLKIHIYPDTELWQAIKGN